MSNNNNEYYYENNQNGLSPQEMEELIEAERREDALRRIKPFLKKKMKTFNKKVAIRRAANLEKRLASRKKGSVTINAAQAATGFAQRAIQPLNQLSMQMMMENDPEMAGILLSTHEASEREAKNAYAQSLLENLRTSTNDFYADYLRQIPTIPKAARGAYVLLGKMDDLYGKLKRNLEIAESDAERKRIAGKMYNNKEAQRLLNKVMRMQDVNPSFPMPPGLQRQINTLLVGENVATLIAPTLPVANRLPNAIAQYEAAKNARYAVLRGQMNAVNSDSRQKIAFLGAIEDALEKVQAQITPSLTAGQLATIQTEIDRITALRTSVEAAIAANTAIPLQDKVAMYPLIREFELEKPGDGLYVRLEKNRSMFNKRNQNAAVEAAIAAPPVAAAPRVSTEEERAAARAARLARFKGGRTHKNKNKRRASRKN